MRDVQVQTSDDGIMLRLPDLGGAPPVHVLLDLSPADAEQRVISEVGTSPLFGARFRMNAGRALLLPRGSARRRMPLWLQRLKALDLLEAVRQFPSLPDPGRDLPRSVAGRVRRERPVRRAAGDLGWDDRRAQSSRPSKPSPFASGLQFAFVMDWLYVDDTPRAERAASWLAVDRSMLDESDGHRGRRRR